MDTASRSRDEIERQIKKILGALQYNEGLSKQGRRQVLLEALAIHVTGLMALRHRDDANGLGQDGDVDIAQRRTRLHVCRG